MINIWKEPFQASLSKHLEAYDIGSSRGDMEYASSNLYQYVNMAIYGCGENFDVSYPMICMCRSMPFVFTNTICFAYSQGITKNIQSYAKRAFQCNQGFVGKALTILLQLASISIKVMRVRVYFLFSDSSSTFSQAFDFMGIEENAFSLNFPGMTEESCFASARENNESSICRYICCKRKYTAFWTGDLDMAAQMYELSQGYPMGSNARLVK
jgi:hypothetical protein